MQRLSLNRQKGFTLVEALLVISIISLLMAVTFFLMNAVENTRLVHAAKTQVQSEVRRAMDWIVNDVRQTVNWSIGSKTNNPSSTHIKFQKVTGFNTAGVGSPILGNYIEYTYDSTLQTITRTDLGTNTSWTFRNIIQAPFFTRKLDNSIVVIDPVVAGDDSPVLNTGNLVVVLAGSQLLGTSTEVTFTLNEEVKIRN